MSETTAMDFERVDEYRKARRRRGWRVTDAEDYGRHVGFWRGYRAEPDVPIDDTPAGLQAGYTEGRLAWRTNHP